MNVLVIGGTGLISTAITRELLARGETVTHYNRGRRAATPDGVRQIVGDRQDFAAFERRMAEAGPFDCVVDMACFAPEEAESAVRAFQGRAAQYLFCSTVDVYAKPAARYPIREDAPRSTVSRFTYAADKAKCEAVFEAAAARGDFPLTMIRPAQTYGEGGRLVHTFGASTASIDRLRKGKPIVVHGDGRSLWAACHRDDVGRAFAGAVGNDRALGRAYHVTGEEWLTWDRYHQAVAEAIGAPPPKLVHIPTDLLNRVAPKRAFICVENFSYNNIFDNTAARDDLGFRQTIPFVEGVRRTIAWLDEQGQIANSDDDPFEDRLIAAWERLGAAMAREVEGLDR